MLLCCGLENIGKYKMTKKSEPKEIMTTKQVADYLKIHPLTVMRHARQGKIPAFKIGADWRFYKKQIDKWLREKLALSRKVKIYKNEPYLIKFD